MLKRILIIAMVPFVFMFTWACSSSKDNGGGGGGTLPSKTFSVQFEGPGGHSNGAYGNVNAVHAAARAMQALDSAEVPVSYVVSDFSGGNSVNSIAATGEFKVTATGSESDLAAFKTILETAVQKGVTDENDFRNIASGDTNSGGGRIDVRGSVSE